MSGFGAGLPADADQQSVRQLVDDLTTNRFARVGDDEPDVIDEARLALSEHGLWTLGASESGGGGGADLPTTLLALARLGGTWPAMAWASVQAHAAALVLDGLPAWAEQLAAIHAGAPVAVVQVQPEDLEVDLEEGRVIGSVARIDPAGRRPHLVLLTGPRTAVVLQPDEVEFGAPVRRTGLDGALTVGVRVAARITDEAVVQGSQVVTAWTMMFVGGAAVASGIAGAAADAALAYSAGRVQFGAPLTALVAVRTSLLAQVGAARAALAASLTTSLAQPMEAAATLSTACDLAIDAAASSLQSHGGYGYMSEYVIEGLLRDAVSLRAASGALDAGRLAAQELVGGVSG